MQLLQTVSPRSVPVADRNFWQGTRRGFNGHGDVNDGC